MVHKVHASGNSVEDNLASLNHQAFGPFEVALDVAHGVHEEDHVVLEDHVVVVLLLHRE